MLINACGGDSGPTQPIILEPTEITGSLLYVNEYGQPHVLGVEYVDGDLQFYVEEFVNFQQTNNLFLDSAFFEGVDKSRPGTFDWSFFDDDNPYPRITAAVRQNNLDNIENDWKKQQIYSIKAADEFQRVEELELMSPLYEAEVPLENFNRFVGARSVSYLDQNRFVVLFSEFVDRDSPDLVVPSNVGYHFVHHLLLFDWNSDNPPGVGEIIWSDNGQHWDRGRIYSSAKKNFLFIFGPRFETTGVSPVVIRSDDYQVAYTPEIKGNQVYDRAPGNEAFALDPHPTADSLFAVSDLRFGTMVLRIPPNKEDRFEIISQVDNTVISPNLFDATEVYYGWTWNITYNYDGSKLAITRYGSKEAGVGISVWDIEDETVRQFQLPQSDGVNYNVIGRAAWDINSPDRRYLFFSATDANLGVGHFFYIDTESASNTAVRIEYQNISYRNSSFPQDQQLRLKTDMLGRKLN